MLVDGTDYSIAWTSGPATPSAAAGTPARYTITGGLAGTYKANLIGKNAYAGSEIEVSVVVSALDLATADITAPDLGKGTGPDNDKYAIGKFLSSGVALAGTEVAVTPLDYTNAAGEKTAGFDKMQTTGLYRYQLSAASTSKNVSGTKIVSVRVVDTLTPLADFMYSDTPLATSFAKFVTSLGQTFNPAALNIDVGTVDVPEKDYDNFTYTVTKDGVAVTEFTEPGTYSLTMVQNIGENYATGGSATGTFTVVASTVDYSTATLYFSLDSKNVAAGAKLPYTTKEYSPVVVAKFNNKVVDASNYTVEFINAKTGEAVEKIAAVGSYELVVTYNNGKEKTLAFSIEKAAIKAATPTASFFALPSDGTAAVPTFVGNTKADLEGISFDLAADQISVAYYKAKYDTAVDKWVKDGNKIAAADLTVKGDYIASINILTTASDVQGTGLDAHFVLSKAAGFSDVDANAWYAQAINKAKKNGYVNGVGGTDLYMPNAAITRAEIAGITFNMAGGISDPESSYPTKFSDVDSKAWFAQAVAWASRAGVVNGYTNTSLFGPFDNTTREQVAAMLYNYAKASGQDVTVDTETVLAKFADGNQVSSWAKTAVAWAADKKIMGNGGELKPGSTITRAEVAAMAVNFQPEPLENPIA